MNGVVSPLAGMICLTVGWLLWEVDKSNKFAKIKSRLVTILALVGSMGVVSTPIGGWAHSAVQWADTTTAHWAWVGFSLVIIGSVWCVGVLAFNVGNGFITKHTMYYATVTPILVPFIPGKTGVWLSIVMAWLGEQVGGFVASQF
jgi:hypothetical protein